MLAKHILGWNRYYKMIAVTEETVYFIYFY